MLRIVAKSFFGKKYQNKLKDHISEFSSISRIDILPQTKKFIEGIRSGNRAALSRSITLVESTKETDKVQAEILLDVVLSGNTSYDDEGTTNKVKTLRVGIAGPPGAGKSTFIESLGIHLVNMDHKVAVLAIDPSSSRSGGSILGDKTRMARLANHSKAYVRPSPTRGALGGVARHTNDIVLLCEACGYDIILVESVGVGQSEIVIDDTVDMVILLVPPGGGDELQGSKKGIMEVSDLIVVNKADGELKSTARHTSSDYLRAVQLLRQKSSHWKVQVTTCSSLEGTGVPEIWDMVTNFRDTMNSVNEISSKRSYQSSKWMWADLQQEVMDLVRKNPKLHGVANKLKEKLITGKISPRSAAKELLNVFMNHDKVTR